MSWRERAKPVEQPSQEGGWRSRAKPIETKEAMSPVDKGFQAVEGAGEAVLSMPVVRGSLEFIGDKFERYVDAPVRAQIGALQEGQGFLDSIKAGGKQLGEKTLPTTPSGKEIMARAGVPTTSLSEVAPSLFSETGEGAKLKRGGILDASPAGVFGVLTQPSTFAIPGSVVAGTASKVGAGATKAASQVGKLASPLAVTAKAGAQAAEKGLFKVGEMMTAGNLKAADALAASKQLKGTQLLAPELYLKGAGKKIGAAREAIEGSGKALTDPAAFDKLSKVKAIIEAGEKKAAKTPGSAQLLERIDEALTSPTGIQVEAIDDMIRDLNTVEYTVQGNPKSIEPRWSKPLGQARGELEGLLKGTPEGKTLSDAKAPYHALETAKGRRSKLMGGLSWVGGIGGGAAVAASNPVLAAATFAASRAIAPRTYFQIVGAAKLPAQAVDTLMAAYQTGKASTIGQAMTKIAERYPDEIAKIATAVSAEGGKSVASEGGAMQRRVRRMAE